MKRPFFEPLSTSAVGLLCLTLGAGCAQAGSKPPAAVPSAQAATQTPSQRMERALSEQARRIGELETRIALLEQEARRTHQSSKPTETVRIGEERRAKEARERAPEPVAVVRLHEDSPMEEAAYESAPAAEWTPPRIPGGIPAKLAVVPLPEERAKAQLAGATAKSPRDQYREALALLTDRKFPDAIAALDVLLAEHPEHGLVPAARYWKGEAQYAQRRYREALIEFESVVTGFPTHAKVPDALLKAGLCHMRLGEGASATRYFEQVRKQYPASQAAKSAPREGST